MTNRRKKLQLLAAKILSRYERALALLKDGNTAETLRELASAEYFVEMIRDLTIPIEARPDPMANAIALLQSLHYRAYYSLKNENNTEEARDCLQVALTLLRGLIEE